jgi:hypothetical protein
MSEREPDFRPASRQSSVSAVVVLVLIAIAAAGGWWYWSQRDVAPPPAPTAAAPDVPEAAPPAPPAVPVGPQNPVEALAEPDAVLPALGDSDAQVGKALAELLGSQRVAALLNIDGFVRRVVTTVDNLTRAQAPSRQWPMQPAPERFSVEGEGARTAIARANSSRYNAFTGLVEAVDVERLAKLYARYYPLFQQAYEELGYPGRYFNDRLVAVIDHLLESPEPAGPVAVQLTEVRGEFTAERPWTRYEFADPALESMSSGQKMMVRVGLANEHRLKAKLRAFRAQVATGTLAKR